MQPNRRPLRRHAAKRHHWLARRHRGQDRAGASVVEFAIVANILLLMVLTCMEFARMNMVRNLAQDAAYFAARHAIVPGATEQEAIDEAERIMSSMVTNGYSVNVTPLNSDETDIRVTVDVDLSQVALFAPYFLPNTNISTVAHMRTERYDGFYEQ